MSTIAFIPVRGGSKSIPEKNIKLLNGKPLVYWVCEACVSSGIFDRIVVSTDSERITSVCLSFEFDRLEVFHRSESTATDTSSTESAILEFIDDDSVRDDDILFLVQATSPFTEGLHLSDAFEKFVSSDFDSMLSVVKSKRFFWNNVNEFGEPVNYDPSHRPRRQDFSGWMMENGAFYASRISGIRETKNRLSGKIMLYEMEEYTGFEIDEPDDWIICENLMKRNRENSVRPAKKRIKLLLSDVDGTLTDSGMYYTEYGDEIKKFNTRDGVAFRLFKAAGVRVGIVTSESLDLLKRRGEKLKLDFVFTGVQDKLSLVRDLCNREGISMEEVAFVGDEFNDAELLREVGWAACPSDAHSSIRSIEGITILSQSGGEGVLREYYDFIVSTEQMNA